MATIVEEEKTQQPEEAIYRETKSLTLAEIQAEIGGTLESKLGREKILWFEKEAYISRYLDSLSITFRDNEVFPNPLPYVPLDRTIMAKDGSNIIFAFPSEEDKQGDTFFTWLSKEQNGPFVLSLRNVASGKDWLTEGIPAIVYEAAKRAREIQSE